MNTPIVKKTDSHKRIALQMQTQIDTLTNNIETIKRLAIEVDNKQLIALCDKAMEAGKTCYSEILAIRTVITRDF